MPANLTAQYRKAEAEYRRASTPEEELHGLQLMLRELPKHKGTDKLQADLKQKISKIKKECESQRGGKKGHGFRVPRQGAGRAVIIGGPNAGKSQLVTALTRATPEVAPYPFTTHEPAPAMMPWEDVMVQLIDTPPITRDMLDPSIQGLIRGADLVLFMLDLGSDEGIQDCLDVLEHLNQTKTRLGDRTYLDETDIGTSYTRSFLVANKIDHPDAELRFELFHEMWRHSFREFRISASLAEGIEELRDAVYRAMNVIRIYTKLPQSKEPDYSKPFTLRRGGTLMEVAELVHKDIARDLKFARVWGSHVHDGTHVKGDYVLHDQDVIEIHS